MKTMSITQIMKSVNNNRYIIRKLVNEQLIRNKYTKDYITAYTKQYTKALPRLEDEVFKSLQSMDNNKSPGSDGLSKEFYECFGDEVKKPFLASIHKAFLNQELSSSQKQAVIKLLEKSPRQEIR